MRRDRAVYLQEGRRDREFRKPFRFAFGEKGYVLGEASVGPFCERCEAEAAETVFAHHNLTTNSLEFFQGGKVFEGTPTEYIYTGHGDGSPPAEDFMGVMRYEENMWNM